MSKILVTGINGFVGHHLAVELKNKGHTVIGTGTGTSLDPALEQLVESYIPECDLTKKDAVDKLPLGDIDAIINLAGLSNVGASFDKEDEYRNVNVLVHSNIAERMKNDQAKIRMVSVSSGAVYNSSSFMPLSENSPLITSGSPYAMSKVKMETTLRAYQENGLDIVIVRPFNHTGPGQLPGFLLPDLYEQVQQAIKTNTPLLTGNLDTKRDYTDVRDVVKAYALLATAAKANLSANVFNVCSGKSVSGREILSILLDACNAPDLQTQTDPSKLRPNDALDIYGSNQRVKNSVGWEPTIDIETTIRDFVSSKQ